MKRSLGVVLATVAVSLLCVGYLYGQQEEKSEEMGPQAKLAVAEKFLELRLKQLSLSGYKDNEAGKEARAKADEVLAILDAAPRDPKLVQAITDRTLWQYQFTKANAKTPLHVSEAANEGTLRLALLQVQQNQRIIALLEQLVQQRPSPERTAAK